MSTTSLTTQVPLTEPELKLLQTLVYQECGMYFDERRTHFLRDRLQRRLKACQLDSFYSYYRLLTSRDGKKELTALVENLTVNETSFFRIRPQLDLFQKVTLEDILKHKQERRDWSLRIWSAGCSTGEEPYTIAILLLRSRLFEGWELEVEATDIAQRVLRVARAGLYGASAFRAPEAEELRPWFEHRDGKWAVRDAVRRLVHFGQANLLDGDAAHGPGRVDALFCRNVLIYFDLEVRRRVLRTFHQRLRPGGYLMLGHSESLMNLTADFELVHLRRDLFYRKPREAEAAP
jgi:chemotaxis protein methyltransferase CheR